MLRSGIESEIDWYGELAKLTELGSDVLVEKFRSGNESLEAEIGSMSDDLLGRMFFRPWAEYEVSFAEFAFIPVWHLDYYAGQINYIQMLLGDENHHSAPA